MKKLLKDKNTKTIPYFVREKTEKVYKGFPLILATETDGFIYGAITDFIKPDNETGCLYGDGFIQAPNGSRAGLMWQVTKDIDIKTMIEPEVDRWGVYSVNFVRPIKTIDDLIYNFRKVLPLLKKKYEKLIN